MPVPYTIEQLQDIKSKATQLLNSGDQNAARTLEKVDAYISELQAESGEVTAAPKESAYTSAELNTMLIKANERLNQGDPNAQDLINNIQTRIRALPPTAEASQAPFTVPEQDLQKSLIAAGKRPVTTRQPATTQEETGLLDNLSEMFTGSERLKQLPEKVRELPELGSGGLFAGEDAKKVALLAPIAATTPKTEELVSIITTMFPNIGAQTTGPDGETILVNNKTGRKVLANKPGFSNIDLLQSLGLLGAFSPAGAARTVATRVGGAVLTQGALEAAQSAAGGEFNPEEAALAGAFAGAAELIAPTIRAFRALRQGATLTPEQTQLLQEAERRGVRVFTSDILPPETAAGRQAQQLTEKIPVVGTGGARAEQQQDRIAALEQVSEELPRVTNEEIVASLRAGASRQKQRAGRTINEIQTEMDMLGPVDTSRTIARIDAAIESLSRPGTVPDEATIANLRQYRELFQENPQNFSTLRENRTALREITDNLDPATRSALPSRSKAAMSSVQNQITDDLERFVRSNTSEDVLNRYRTANAVYANEAQRLKNTKLRDILSKGEVTPEKVENLLFSRKPSEVRLLFEKLPAEGRIAGRVAILNRALRDAGVGTAEVSTKKFTNSLTRMRDNIDIFFTGSHRQELEAFERLIRSTERAAESPATTATGQQILPFLALTASLPAAGGGITVGTLGRIVESRPVRSALLRYRNTAPGSENETRILNQVLLPAIQAAQQKYRD